MAEESVGRIGGAVRRGRADPHMHTTASDGLASPAELIEAVLKTGLDVIAVTDHDTVTGALAVRDLVARAGYPLDVIVGIEVTAARGVHILGLFVEEALPMLRPIEETVEAIARAGGICLAPHPLSPLTPSLGKRAIDRLIAGGFPIIGVETLNPSPAGRVVRRQIAESNRTWKLAEFGGSDAHFPNHIASAYTTFPGHTAADFRQALLDKTTTAHLSTTPMPRVPLSNYIRQSGRSMILNPAQKIVRRWQKSH